MAPPADVLKKAKLKLQQFRDHPPGSADVSDADLTLLVTVLIQDDASKDDTPHWFCSKAHPVAVDAATFLFRLHAYQSPRVEKWRTQLRRCITNCAKCVQQFQEAKTIARHTYFAAFADATVTNFFKSIVEWELQILLDALLPADGPSNPTPCSASMYHLCSNPVIQKSPKFSQIEQILESHPPQEPYSDWPTDVPPPGLFLLMMSSNPTLSTWASRQLHTYQTTPIPVEHFAPIYVETLQEATNQVALTEQTVSDETALWTSYSNILRYVPPPFLKPSASFGTDIRRIVLSHLSDVGNHFVHTLKSFALLLTRIGPELFKDQDLGYTVVVFSAIKDNPRFEDLIASQSEIWSLNWIQSFVKAAGELPEFTDVFPIIIQCLCEQLQHTRFKDVRPRAIEVACKTLEVVVSDSPAKGARHSPEYLVACSCVDIHASMFITVGFDKAYAHESWRAARAAVRQLVKQLFSKDAKAISTTISALARPSGKAPVPETPSIREHMWIKIYKTMQPNDVDGIAMLLSIIAQISHIDKQTNAAYDHSLKQFADFEAANKVREQVNRATQIFRKGFADAAARFELEDTSTTLALLNSEGVPTYLTMLMISPVDGLREPAQNIVSLALEVDSRPDCFRALLKKYTRPTMAGILGFLNTFSVYTRIVPEACNVSKSLALCLTDVIDVMCSRPEGLLLDSSFVKSLKDSDGSNVLLTWWQHMAKALTVIFLRTPRWVGYFDSQVMVVWMRDALIFGRDMLAQRKVIETAVAGHTPGELPSNDKRLSRIAKKMVEDLQDPLSELPRWLRLTDEELLHQSFALLDTLLACFLQTSTVKPPDEALHKLRRIVNDAQGTGKKGTTYLDASRAKNLHKRLLQFEEDDDEVQFIEMKPSERAKSKVKASVSEKPGPSRPNAFTLLKDSSSIRKPTVQQKSSVPSASSSRSVFVKSQFFGADDQKKLNASVPSALTKFKTSAKSAPTPPLPIQSFRASESIKTRSDASSVASTAPSSSSSSESEEEGTLESLAKVQRTPKIKRPTERRQVKMMDMPVNARNAAIDRINRKEDPRARAARTRPDVSSLHRRVLSWNYSHDGPEPPGDKLPLLRVPDRFSDVEHYRRVFEPLLLMECWAQIQQSKEVPQESFECRIVSRAYADDWAELDVTFEEGTKRDWQLSETDIVLLKRIDPPAIFLAKTHHFRSQRNMPLQATLRMAVGQNGPGPQIDTKWMLSKVFSLTTVHREYAALVAMRYYGLCDTILQPRLSKQAITDQQEMHQTMSAYNLNEPQAKAVLSSIKSNGFSLIQGPPGTGKTSTICGLVQIFLSRRPKPATAVTVGRNSGPADKEPPQKILLCAPSNAAIDEITYRVKQGISGGGKQSVVPKVVRVGAPQAMNSSVQDVALDVLVKAKVEESPEGKKQDSNTSNEINMLRADLNTVKSRREQIFVELKNVQNNLERERALKEELGNINKRRGNLTTQLDKLRDQAKSDYRSLDALSRRIRAEILRDADVICTTLSGSGHEQLEPFDFEMVVIDEAAQAIELSSLIPLKYRCSRCVMVGDPQQLPPTVISQEASKFAYNQSLFVRLQKQRPDVVHLLSIQYRMHPEISILPSSLFYQSRLLDGPSMADKTQKPWHSNPRFGVYRFFNIHRGLEETTLRHSYKNNTECQVAVALYNRLTREYSYDFDTKIGIVSMYKAQVDALRSAFVTRFGESIKKIVDFNTVDGFQGQEKEVIILSCVRAGPGVQSVGFLSDVRRMNVALTRAKSSLFVLGHAATLERSDQTWKSIVGDARQRSHLVDTDVTFFTSSQPQPNIRPAKPVRTQQPLPVTSGIDQQAPTLSVQKTVVPPPIIEDKMEISSEPPSADPSAGPSRPPSIPQKRQMTDDDNSLGQASADAERNRPKTMPPKKRKKRAQEDILFIKKK